MLTFRRAVQVQFIRKLTKTRFDGSRASYHRSMLILNDIALDEQILTQPFACDLKQCKGACCTLSGGSGAPLREEEIAPIEAAKDQAMEYLSESSRAYIKSHGWLDGSYGDRTVGCIDDKQCVFVFWEDDIARCALERAYKDGKTAFRKPISCHLFPIRIADFGGPYLYYDVFSECKPALANGEKLGLAIKDITRDALVREFGAEWVEALDALAQQQSH